MMIPLESKHAAMQNAGC